MYGYRLNTACTKPKCITLQAGCPLTQQAVRAERIPPHRWAREVSFLHTQHATHKKHDTSVSKRPPNDKSPHMTAPSCREVKHWTNFGAQRSKSGTAVALQSCERGCMPERLETGTPTWVHTSLFVSAEGTKTNAGSGDKRSKGWADGSPERLIGGKIDTNKQSWLKGARVSALPILLISAPTVGRRVARLHLFPHSLLRPPLANTPPRPSSALLYLRGRRDNKGEGSETTSAISYWKGGGFAGRSTSVSARHPYIAVEPE